MRNAGGEHEFGPAEHREGAVLADIAPGEVHKSGSGPAVDRCVAQIQSGLAGDNLDRDRPRPGSSTTGIVHDDVSPSAGTSSRGCLPT
jgi:hypothetical protein